MYSLLPFTALTVEYFFIYNLMSDKNLFVKYILQNMHIEVNN